MSEAKIAQLRADLLKTFQAEAAKELVSLVKDSADSRTEARELLFRIIDKDPRDLASRLQLAKLFYLDKLTEFAVRELLEIRRRGDSPAISRLIDSFGQLSREFSFTSPKNQDLEQSDESIVGELDIDFDEVEDEIS